MASGVVVGLLVSVDGLSSTTTKAGPSTNLVVVFGTDVVAADDADVVGACDSESVLSAAVVVLSDVRTLRSESDDSSSDSSAVTAVVAASIVDASSSDSAMEFSTDGEVGAVESAMFSVGADVTASEVASLLSSSTVEVSNASEVVVSEASATVEPLCSSTDAVDEVVSDITGGISASEVEDGAEFVVKSPEAVVAVTVVASMGESSENSSGGEVTCLNACSESATFSASATVVDGRVGVEVAGSVDVDSSEEVDTVVGLVGAVDEPSAVVSVTAAMSVIGVVGEAVTSDSVACVAEDVDDSVTVVADFSATVVSASFVVCRTSVVLRISAEVNSASGVVGEVASFSASVVCVDVNNVVADCWAVCSASEGSAEVGSGLVVVVSSTVRVFSASGCPLEVGGVAEVAFGFDSVSV